MKNEIVKVERDDEIKEIAELAGVIWRDHFTRLIGEAQVEYMLGKFQSFSAIKSQIDEGYEYFVIRKDDKITGYISLFSEPVKSDMILSKIYVLKEKRGSGLGKELLKFATLKALKEDIGILSLAVNKGNKSTIDWYLKRGFVIKEGIKKDIGAGFVMDDYIMKKAL